MSTFQVRVQDYIGDTGATADTVALNDWLTEGARLISDRFKPERLAIYATDKTDAGSGIAITGGRPLSAHKSGYEARFVPVGMKAVIADGSSIHYAIATDPAWYIDSTKAYVLPGGGTVKWFAYPTVAYTESSISNFPPQGYAVVIIYTAIQGQVRNINDLLKTTIGGLAFTTPTAITAPTAPSFTWTDAVIGTYTATTLATTATVPTYTKPTQTFDVTQLETFLETNTDAELADRQLGRLDHEIKEYQLDIQNEKSEFEKEVVIYQGVIQQEIKQAELTQNQILKLASDTTELNKFNELQTLAEQVQEYQAVLGKHQSDVSNYASQVGAEAQRLQLVIQQHMTTYAGYLEVLKNLKEEYNRSLETL